MNVDFATQLVEAFSSLHKLNYEPTDEDHKYYEEIRDRIHELIVGQARSRRELFRAVEGASRSVTLTSIVPVVDAMEKGNIHLADVVQLFRDYFDTARSLAVPSLAAYAVFHEPIGEPPRGGNQAKAFEEMLRYALAERKLGRLSRE